MKYARIIGAVAATPWAIHPSKGQAIVQFLAYAAAGGKRSIDEITGAIGRPSRHAYDDDESADERRARMAAQDARTVEDRGGIAVLSLSGIISPRVSDEMDVSGPGGTSAESFVRRINSAMSDARVAGVIIDVDSPGGSVFGVPEAFEAIMAHRGTKPIVAVANPFMASAAYWIASAADEIVVTPSGEVGSIGVYGYHEDLSKALADAGVAPTLIKAAISPDKAETHPAFPLTDRARAELQASVDRYGAMFVADVARARNASVGRVVEAYGGGRMVSADDAVAAGMADRTGTLDAEIKRMADLIAKPSRSPRKAHARRAALL